MITKTKNLSVVLWKKENSEELDTNRLDMMFLCGNCKCITSYELPLLQPTSKIGREA